VRKVALVLTLSLVLLFAAFFMFPVQAEQWSTIQVPTPNLSPYVGTSITYDGSKIAFYSYIRIYFGGDYFVTSDPQIFVVNSDGTELKQLLPTNPNWLSISAVGSKIAFLSKADGISEILVGDSNGTDLTSITANLPSVVYTFDPPSIVSLFDFTFPSISGDGSKIAFVSRQLFVINSDGTGLTQVANIEGSVEYPSISVDGSNVAFLSKVGEAKYDLYVATDLQADLENMNTPAQTASPTATPSVQPSNPEPFPTTLVATASTGAAVVIGSGLLIYFKKCKH
jgi:Tol biopolymer transport system component